MPKPSSKKRLFENYQFEPITPPSIQQELSSPSINSATPMSFNYSVANVEIANIENYPQVVEANQHENLKTLMPSSQKRVLENKISASTPSQKIMQPPSQRLHQLQCSTLSNNNSSDPTDYTFACNNYVVPGNDQQYVLANTQQGVYNVNENGMYQSSDSILQHGIAKISNIDQLLQIQQNMAYKLSKMDSRMSNLEKMVEQILDKLSFAERPVNSEQSIETFDDFQIIDSIENLELFEKKLANLQFKNSTVSV